MEIYIVYGLTWDFTESIYTTIGKVFLSRESALDYINAEMKEISTTLKGCFEHNQIGKYYVSNCEYYESDQTHGEYTISVNLNFDNYEQREFANDLGTSLFESCYLGNIEISAKKENTNVIMRMLELKLDKKTLE